MVAVSRGYNNTNARPQASDKVRFAHLIWLYHQPSKTGNTMNKKDSYPWYILRCILCDIAIYLFMIIAVSFSLYLTFTRYNDAVDWFARSGSLIVICAGAVEYRRLNIYQKHPFNNVISKSLTDIFLVDKIVIIFKFLELFSDKCALFIMITGTIIWGYGDIPFR